MIISSQQYLNDEIVAAKLAARDFTVTLSPEFEIDGDVYQTIIDGHHSLEAARQAGVEPEYVIAGHDDDRLFLLDQGLVNDFLETGYIDSPWYDIADGVPVW